MWQLRQVQVGLYQSKLLLLGHQKTLVGFTCVYLVGQLDSHLCPKYTVQNCFHDNVTQRVLVCATQTLQVTAELRIVHGN